MIKVCVISPASHLEQFSSLGDCEMSLTHLIVKDAGFHHSDYVKQNYIKYYKKQAAKGRWVILDNSAYEIGRLETTQASGRGLGPELVLNAAEIIKPSIVIAQDVLCDRDATLQSTKEFINYVKKKKLLGSFRIMGVAQGKTKEEWLRSYEDMLDIDEIDQIGFSKIAVPLSFGSDQVSSGCVSLARLKCTEIVDDMFGRLAKNAHLLGGDNWLPWELEQQKKYKWIYSNDSSAVVWYGGHKKQYNDEGKIEDIIIQKPDLENNNDGTVELLNQSADCIYRNIALLHKMTK